jgi:hypothetical protein
MANYEKRSCLNGRIRYGPEDVNGTGQVYFNADEAPCWLNEDEVVELILALAGALSDARQNKDDINSPSHPEPADGICVHCGKEVFDRDGYGDRWIHTDLSVHCDPRNRDSLRAEPRKD